MSLETVFDHVALGARRTIVEQLRLAREMPRKEWTGMLGRGVFSLLSMLQTRCT